MRYYFYNTPKWLKGIYPSLTWTIQEDSKSAFLTFDDGPVPGATNFVLDTLEKYEAKATFFVVGDNVRKHPRLLDEIIERGHSVGNHTFNHLSGWRTDTERYLENVERCDECIEKHLGKRTEWFRPPYGRIKRSQLKEIKKSHKIVMWQILSGDFDLGLNHNSSIQNISKAKQGDILVFHDSNKYLQNVKKVLPESLETLKKLGFSFKAL